MPGTARLVLDRLLLTLPLFFWVISPRAIGQTKEDIYKPDIHRIPASRQIPTFEMHKILGEKLETKPFQRPMPLMEFLTTLRARIPGKGKDLGFVVDEISFFAGNPSRSGLLEKAVTCPEFPRHLSLRSILRLAVSQISYDAMFRIRESYVEITTSTRASNILEIDFEALTVNKPLERALDESRKRAAVGQNPEHGC